MCSMSMVPEMTAGDAPKCGQVMGRNESLTLCGYILWFHKHMSLKAPSKTNVIEQKGG